MANRRRFTSTEALEMVMEDGSDVEDDIIRPFEDEEDDYGDVDQSTVPVMDDFDVESGEESDDELAASSRRSVSVGISGTGDCAGPSNGIDTPFQFEIDPSFDSLDEATDVVVDAEYMTKWTRDLTDFPIVPPFTGTPGLGPAAAHINNDSTPLDFYELFVDRELIRHMKSQTNVYATSCIQAKERSGVHISDRSLFRKWKCVTVTEVYKFIAILLHMSLVIKPFINDYWCKHPSLATSFTNAIKMSRDRFKSILMFFHLNDNSTFIPRGVDGHDPLHKVRPLHDHLIQKFKEVYTPSSNICIDEALCPWRGRSHMRVYMKDKPVKWGIKLYELCDSATGYVWTFEVMSGQPNRSNSPYDVVMRLISPLLDQGYTLFIDNYYCNPLLCDTLVANNTSVVGTVRANRIGLPTDLMTTPLATGEMDYRRKNQVLALKWKDKRDVQILTTKHLPEMAPHTTRTTTKQKPTAVIDYTTHMGGVDHSDQLIAYTPLHRKIVKWWKKLSFHFLTLCMVQAYTLYSQQRQRRGLKHVRLSRFIMEVCVQIATLRCGFEPIPQPPNPTGSLLRLTERHFAEPINEGKKSRKACFICYAKASKAGASRQELRNKVKRTEYCCKPCDKSLCPYPCFMDYHTKEDYLN